jgi:hypothetical protein
MNVSERFPEPFMDNKVSFRGNSSSKAPTQALLLSNQTLPPSPQKKRNISQIKAGTQPVTSLFRNSPVA